MPMPRERAKVKLSQKRFKLLPAKGHGPRIIVDQDADPGVDSDPLRVAQVDGRYAAMVCATMNEHQEWLALRPAKHQRTALCAKRDPTNNAWWACSQMKGHTGMCLFSRKSPKTSR